jgi:hypothetical protein
MSYGLGQMAGNATAASASGSSAGPAGASSSTGPGNILKMALDTESSIASQLLAGLPGAGAGTSSSSGLSISEGGAGLGGGGSGSRLDVLA